MIRSNQVNKYLPQTPKYWHEGEKILVRRWYQIQEHSGIDWQIAFYNSISCVSSDESGYVPPTPIPITLIKQAKVTKFWEPPAARPNTPAKNKVMLKHHLRPQTSHPEAPVLCDALLQPLWNYPSWKLWHHKSRRYFQKKRIREGFQKRHLLYLTPSLSFETTFLIFFVDRQMLTNILEAKERR